MPGPREVKYLLSCRVHDHGRHLIAREALVLERIFLPNHFVEDLVALGRNFFGSLFSFVYVFVVLAFEEHAVCEEYFDEMEGHDEAQVPFKEGEKMALAFNDLVVRRNDSLTFLRLLLFIVVLDIVNKDKLVINFVVL